MPPRAGPAAAISVEVLPLERLPAPDPGAPPCGPVPLALLGGDGVKYSARPFSFALSGLDSSHSSMKNAIIAVTKSA